MGGRSAAVIPLLRRVLINVGLAMLIMMSEKVRGAEGCLKSLESLLSLRSRSVEIDSERSVP